MGRTPCDKPKEKHRKGLWSPDEDEKLRSYILRHGHGCWSSVPAAAGLQRNGKSCRLRWINYLRPGLKRGLFTLQEKETILTLHATLGNKWSQIANQMPGRTDNEIKNYWHSYLKKRVVDVPIEGQLSEQVSPNSVMTVTCLDSLVSREGSSSSSSQQVNENVTKRDLRGSSLPRILFEEWLTLDDDSLYSNPNKTFSYSQYSNTSNDGTRAVYSNSSDGVSGDFNLYDAYGNFQDNTLPFGISNNEEITLEEQVQGSLGIEDLLHGDEMCSEYMFGNLMQM